MRPDAQAIALIGGRFDGKITFHRPGPDGILRLPADVPDPTPEEYTEHPAPSVRTHTRLMLYRMQPNGTARFEGEVSAAWGGPVDGQHQQT